MISLRGLECLVAIVDHGSLTKAAAVLHISQPALSHQIANIEREVGTAVLERMPRGVRPTAAGLAAADQARVALAAANKAVAAAKHTAAGTDGRIRVAVAETMSGWLLAPVLRDWSRRHAGVAIDLREYTNTDHMLDVLLSGGADISISPPPAAADQRTEVLGTEEIVAVAAQGHRFADMNAVPLTELVNERLVHYHPGNGNAAWVDAFAARLGVILPQPVVRTGSSRTAAQLAAAGVGVAIVAASALTPRPDATIRSFDPPELRNVTVSVAAPHDELVARFVADLRKQGVPSAFLAGACPTLLQVAPRSRMRRDEQVGRQRPRDATWPARRDRGDRFDGRYEWPKAGCAFADDRRVPSPAKAAAVLFAAATFAR